MSERAAAVTDPRRPEPHGLVLLASAVIVHDVAQQRVLLLRRGPGAKFGQGLWDLPCGKNESSEPITTTAVRELREETGLAVDPVDLRVVHVIHGARGVEAPTGFLSVVFATNRWHGEPVNLEPAKHSCVAWADTRSIPNGFVSSTRDVLLAYLDGTATMTLDGWPDEPHDT
ncbi:MAG TPA: NUDIX domain-containing protein [Kineosporiaceae bacterium]